MQTPSVHLLGISPPDIGEDLLAGGAVIEPAPLDEVEEVW